MFDRLLALGLFVIIWAVAAVGVFWAIDHIVS